MYSSCCSRPTPNLPPQRIIGRAALHTPRRPCCALCMCPCFSPPVLSQSPCHTNATPRASQGLKLPLHYAAAKGAPFGVMELLLGANPKAVNEADKARS